LIEVVPVDHLVLPMIMEKSKAIMRGFRDPIQKITAK